jgi:hypothetical protein
MKLEFLDIFPKSPQISNFMKIRPVGEELFHADRQTDMTKLIVPFRNFANAPKNRSWQFAKSLASEWPAVIKACTPLTQTLSEQA